MEQTNTAIRVIDYTPRSDKDVERILSTEKAPMASLTEDYIERTLPTDILADISTHLRNGCKLYIESSKKHAPLSKEFLELVFPTSMLLMFTSKVSTSIKCIPISFLPKYKQFANTYYMPVGVKEWGKTKTSNQPSKCRKITYTSTDRNNINTVYEFMLDIDVYHNADKPNNADEELEALCKSIVYFTEEEDIAPTAIVNTGRGLQAHYVFSKPIYRNNEVMDKLLLKAYSSIREKYNEILSSISPNLKVDPATNPINQKMRLPGTLNFSSGSYSYVAYLNKERTYMLDDLLYTICGRYKEPVKKQPTTKDTNSDNGNNGNGRNNLFNLLVNRLDDIQGAVEYVGKTVKSGFRDNAYFTYSYIYYNLAIKSEKYKWENLPDILFEIDKKICSPYFKNIRQVKSFCDSVLRHIENRKHYKLTNKSICSYCIVLDIAHRKGYDFKVFFKETTTEKRNRNSKLIHNKRQQLNNCIIKVLKNEMTLQEVMKECGVSRSTVYRVLKALKNSTNTTISNNRKCKETPRKAHNNRTKKNSTRRKLAKISHTTTTKALQKDNTKKRPPKRVHINKTSNLSEELSWQEKMAIFFITEQYKDDLFEKRKKIREDNYFKSTLSPEEYQKRFKKKRPKYLLRNEEQPPQPQCEGYDGIDFSVFLPSEDEEEDESLYSLFS